MVDRSENQGCLGLIRGLLGLGRTAHPQGASRLPYRLDPMFMSPAELSFYRVLKTHVGDRYKILVKVGLGDMFRVTSKEDWRSYRNKIDRKHVDFLLCDPETLVPRLAIELDDGSHLGERRVERDAFVNEVFAAAGLPLKRMPVMRAYTAKDIEQLLVASDSLPELPDPPSNAPSPASVPICPDCGLEMVLRVATRGKHKGRKFYGCVDYPMCRQVFPYQGG